MNKNDNREEPIVSDTKKIDYDEDEELETLCKFDNKNVSKETKSFATNLDGEYRPSVLKLVDEEDLSKSSNLKRVLNTIVCIILFSIVFSAFIITLAQNHFKQVYYIFQPEVTSFKINFEIFIVVWILLQRNNILIIKVFLFFIILRLIYISKERYDSFREVAFLVNTKFSYNYLVGNVLTILALFSFYVSISRKYGGTTFLTFLASGKVHYYLVKYQSITLLCCSE
jgi:hypothetical protein